MVDIAGAGISGLTAGYMLSRNDIKVKIFEKGKVGGMLASNQALRYMHNTPEVIALLNDIKCNYAITKRRAKVYWNHAYVSHPFDDEEFIKQYTEKSTKANMRVVKDLIKNAKHDENQDFVLLKESLIDKLIGSFEFELVEGFYKRDETAATILTTPVFYNMDLLNSLYKRYQDKFISRYVYGFEFAVEENLSRNSTIIYVPQTDIVFHRVSIPENLHLMNQTIEKRLVCEVSSPMILSKSEIEYTMWQCMKGLEKMGLVYNLQDCVIHSKYCIPNGYMLQTEEAIETMQKFAEEAKKKNVYFLGRFAEWSQDDISRTIVKAKWLSTQMANVR